jgi:8-oxo-dGTP pyrophosphatase MutT (NUDIX family)
VELTAEPRPPTVRVVESPLSRFAGQLRVRLADPRRPGAPAQTRMAPQPRRSAADPAALVDAAVLLLLYPLDRSPGLVLTRRTDTLAHHRSQVSFPGGRLEAGESVEAAALREAAEELAVDPAAVTVLGRLSALDVAASGHRIHPVAGWTGGRPAFVPHPGEVAAVIEARLDALDASVRVETWTHDGLVQRVPFYFVDGHKVWGATAMILSELLALVAEIDPAA